MYQKKLRIKLQKMSGKYFIYIPNLCKVNKDLCQKMLERTATDWMNNLRHKKVLTHFVRKNKLHVTERILYLETMNISVFET